MTATTTPTTPQAGYTQCARRCISCNQAYYLNVRTLGLNLWQNKAAFIQDALPELDAGDRELLMSSMCEPCFDKMFGEGDDNDDESIGTDGDPFSSDPVIEPLKEHDDPFGLRD